MFIHWGILGAECLLAGPCVIRCVGTIKYVFLAVPYSMFAQRTSPILCRIIPATTPDHE